jgi:hypothetical protein
MTSYGSFVATPESLGWGQSSLHRPGQSRLTALGDSPDWEFSIIAMGPDGE